MRLVRMQHEHLARQALPRGAAIAERLHARDGVADRIGVVAVRIEAVAGEIRLDPLDAVRRRRGAHPVCTIVQDAAWLPAFTSAIRQSITASQQAHRHGRSARLHPRRSRARRQSRSGDAQPRGDRRGVRQPARPCLHGRHRRRHGAGDGDHGVRRDRPRAGAAGRDAGRRRRSPRSISSIWPGASRPRRRWPRMPANGASPRSPPAFSCRWSIRRAMPRWRRCSPASC